MAAVAASPFDELLRLGSSLGLKPAASPSTAATATTAATTRRPPPPTTQNLSAIADAVECCQEAHRARAELLRLRELERLAPLAAPRALARRRAAIDGASRALERTADGRLALARRLREARVRPGVPVDPARQPEFSALLRHAAGGGAILRHGGRLLREAVEEVRGGGGESAAAAAAAAAGGRSRTQNPQRAAAEAAARWEEGLRPLAEAAAACRERVEALEAFARAMAMEGDGDGAGAAAGWGSGGGGDAGDAGRRR
jgi:hypothetical protein